MIVSRSGDCLDDFKEQIDQLPPSVRIVVLHIGTNDLSTSYVSTAFFRHFNLVFHAQSRPGA